MVHRLHYAPKGARWRIFDGFYKHLAPSGATMLMG